MSMSPALLLSHPICPALVNQVLKHARFAHANPFRSLKFFNLITSSNLEFTSSPFAYDILVRSLEKVEMGLELWGDMVEKGFRLFRQFSNVLFELFCDCGKLEEAKKYFVGMVELGQKLSNVSFKRIKDLMEPANKGFEWSRQIGSVWKFDEQ